MMGVWENVQNSSFSSKEFEKNLNDPEKFIEYDNLLETYNDKSIQLVEGVMNFWAFLENEDIDIDKQINQSFKVSDLIKEVYDYHYKLDLLN